MSINEVLGFCDSLTITVKLDLHQWKIPSQLVIYWRNIASC